MFTAAVLALALAPSPPAGAAKPKRPCRANLASELAGTRSALQLVTVEAPSEKATSGTLVLWRRNRGCWKPVAGPWRARLGWRGVSDNHLEGDLTTPAGVFALGPVIYGIAPDPGVRLGYHRLVCGDWWDEDPSSPAYNTFQHVACGSIPAFSGSSEPLWRSPTAYAHFAVIEYNVHPAVPGRGSAMFVHADIGEPTNGCVTLPLNELTELLRRLRPVLRPAIVIGTSAEIRHF